MKTVIKTVINSTEITKRCGFCYDREQGKNGEIKREWSQEWMTFIPVCRKHSLADGMINGKEHNEKD